MNRFRDRPPIPCGSSPTAVASSSFLLLLGSCFRRRLRCRFSGRFPRVVGLAGATHIRHLLACTLPELYQLIQSFANIDRPRNAHWFKSCRCHLRQLARAERFTFTSHRSIWLVPLQSGPGPRCVVLSGLPLACPREHHSPRRNRLFPHP